MVGDLGDLGGAGTCFGVGQRHPSDPKGELRRREHRCAFPAACPGSRGFVSAARALSRLTSCLGEGTRPGPGVRDRQGGGC